MKRTLVASLISLTSLFFINHAIACDDENSPLQTQRQHVIKQYISDLQTANHKDIAQLFEKDGFVISTSRGKVNAKEFFASFLPSIKTANTELHQSFASHSDKNRYAARFNFNFKLKDGEISNGEYIDEFVFKNQSAKLSAVYMFENMKFNTTTK